jgi:hypothetical protein
MDVVQARWSRRVMIHISPLVRAAFADDGVGRPEQRMGVAVHHLACFHPSALVDQRHHRASQRLSSGERWIGRLPPKQIRDEGSRRSGIDRPVGDEQRARPGVEEGAPQPRQRIGTTRGPGCRQRSSQRCTRMTTWSSL